MADIPGQRIQNTLVHNTTDIYTHVSNRMLGMDYELDFFGQSKKLLDRGEEEKQVRSTCVVLECIKQGSYYRTAFFPRNTMSRAIQKGEI